MDSNVFIQIVVYHYFIQSVKVIKFFPSSCIKLYHVFCSVISNLVHSPYTNFNVWYFSQVAPGHIPKSPPTFCNKNLLNLENTHYKQLSENKDSIDVNKHSLDEKYFGVKKNIVDSIFTELSKQYIQIGCFHNDLHQKHLTKR